MNDDLQSYIEPELEARIVALVLGEASAFEAEELERLMKERPELRAYRKKVEKTHGLVGEAFEEKDDTGWKLSDERWERVSSKIEEEKLKNQALTARQRKKRLARQKLVYACAACLVLTLIALVLGGAIFSMGSIKSASASYEDGSEKRDLLEFSVAQRDQEAPFEEMSLAEDRKSFSNYRTRASGEAKPGSSSESASLVAERQSVSHALVALDSVILPTEPESEPRNLTTSFRTLDSSLGEGVVTRSTTTRSKPEAAPTVEAAPVVGALFGTNEGNRDFSLAKKTKETPAQATAFPQTPATPAFSADGIKIAANEKEEGNHWDFEFTGNDSEGFGTGGFGYRVSPDSTGQIDAGIVAGGAIRGGKAKDKESSLAETESKRSSAFFVAPEDQNANAARPGSQPLALDENVGIVREWGIEGESTKSKNNLFARGKDQLTQPEGEDDLRRNSEEPRPEVLLKPRAPSSSPRGAVAANAALPATIPAPDPAAPIPSEDSNLGDDFGLGWAGKPTDNGRSLAEQETLRRQVAVKEADEKLVAGREAYAKGDYEDAVEHYREAAGILPAGTATEDRKKVINDHLADGSIALTQKYRRLGRNEEARELLSEVEKNDPGNISAKKGLEYLDDPIRTNPALTDELSKNVDKVRRNLYEGEGFYDLGLYDKAEEKFKNVIRIDPYNKAARRWMERAASIKSDYYRAAYDQTRAEMLMEVDREWESAVPSEESDEGGLSAGNGKNASLDEFHEMTGLTTEALMKGMDGGVADNLSAFLPSDMEGERMKGRDSIFQTGTDSLFGEEFGVVTPPAESADSQGILEGVGERSLTSKGNQIIFPEVDFNKATVKEALEFVRLRAIELDSTTLDESQKGVNLIADQSDVLSRVLPNMKMENVPMQKVLEKVAELSGTSLEVDEFAYRFSKKQAPNVFEDSTDGETDRQSRAKLNQIILPEIRLENSSLSETVDFLKLRSKELDTTTLDVNELGLEIVIEDPKLKKEILEGRRIAELQLKNVPLRVAVEEVARMAGCKVRIDDGRVIFFSDPTEQSVVLPEGFETLTAEKSDSTFSLNVSDVSFKLAKAALAEGNWPDASKVRPEEFVNALDYDDTKPDQSEKIACVIEQGSHPFMQQRNLMRIAMSTASLGRNASTPLRLTILFDQSGSMERADRAESVKRAFALLSAQLNANDEISLVGFARTPRLLAERLKGDQSAQLAEIVANPLTEGGTNLEAALATGLEVSKQQYLKGAQNRIILLTDGAANLGDALPENLARQVESMRQHDIAFDACGVGADGLNDEILSSLAKQGDGRYYFLDRPEDADDGFAKQIAGALRPAAKNVKVQILFNPERVSKFKLYGFEKHKLKKEDFRNDSVDAAEMAAEESGVALYHFEPMPEGRGDIGTVSVRFLDTATKQMVERTWAIPYQAEADLFSEAKPTLRLAGIAGLFAEKLKGSPVGERVEFKRLRQETELLKPAFNLQSRFHELSQMLQQAGQ